MSRPIHDKEKGRKALKNKIARRIPGTLRLVILVAFLLVGSFVLYRFVIAQARDAGGMFVTFSSKDCPNKYSFSETRIDINGPTATGAYVKEGDSATVFLSPGTYTISGLRMPDYPGAKMFQIRVKSIRGEGPYIDASSGSATVELTPEMFSSEVRPTIEIITTNDCPGQEKKRDKQGDKEIRVNVGSYDCKSPPHWPGLKVKIDETEFDTFDGAAVGAEVRSKMIKIGPGKHEISVRSTDFPKTSNQEVSVTKYYSSGRVKRVGPSYLVGASGLATVTLDESLWEETDQFIGVGLNILVWGNCADPKTEPAEFGIVKVIAVSGEVEAQQPAYFRPGDTVSSSREFVVEYRKARVGDHYREGTTIKTGTNGIIVLESEYKHTITIESCTEEIRKVDPDCSKRDYSTEVQLSTLMTDSGRRQLTAFLKKGTIKIERHSSKTEIDFWESVQSKNDELMRNKMLAPSSITTDILDTVSKLTAYSVSYDETTKQTTVRVEEGEVKVFPENESFQPVVLRANQQIQVTENNVSPIMAYTPNRGGSNAARILLYVGIGVVGLLALTTLLFFFRRQQRLSMQPALHPTGVNPTEWKTPPVKVASPVVNKASQKCPNPQCGKESRAGKKFCAHCGTPFDA